MRLYSQDETVDSRLLRYGDAPGADPHPLLGGHVSDPDDDGRHLWQGRLGPRTLPWLDEHLVQGLPVLPGAAFCEMALASAGAVFATEPDRVRVTDVNLHRPLPLAEDATVTTTATVLTACRARWQLATGDRTVSAAAELHLLDNPPEHEYDEVRRLIADHPRETRPADFYARRAGHRGVERGPAFRGLARIQLSGRGSPGVLAHLDLPESARPGTRSFLWHPILLDSCVQALVALWTATVDLPEGAVVPDRFGALRVRGDTAHGRYCHGRLDLAGGDSCTGSFRLLAGDGAVLAEVDGVRLVHVARHTDRDRFDGRLLQVRWEPAGLPRTAASDDGGRWLLLAENDAGDRPAALAAALRARGDAVQLAIIPLDADPAEVITGAIASAPGLRGIAVIAPRTPLAPEEATLDRAARRVQRLVRVAQAVAAGATPPRLWMVTDGAQQVLPDDEVALEQAGLRGLVRVLAHEQPASRPTVLDADATVDAEQIATELRATADRDDEVAWRRGTRYVARLRVAPMRDEERVTAACRFGEDALALRVRTAGQLDTLELVRLERRVPGPNEVEIQVLASGSNHVDARDTTAASGCAGLVAATGRAVRDLRVGDRVAAVVGAGELSSFVTVRAGWAIPVPWAMSLETAATLPVAYLTAWYGLRHLGRLVAGERVLVDPGRGGLRAAAVGVANACGAQVVARDSTGSADVDLVFRSAAGRAHRAGLDRLAACGRFVEIDSGDRSTDRTPRRYELRRGVTLSSLDLPSVMASTPWLVDVLMREIGEAVEDGRLPVPPHRVHSIDAAATALRDNAGDVVLTWPEEGAATAVVTPDLVRVVRPSGSYIVTGGLGELGLLVARWLARRGAASIALSGRSAPTDHARAVLDELRQRGTRVEVVHGDVADPGVAGRLVAAATAGRHPLHGVLHGAAVVEEAAVGKLDPHLLYRAWRPKVVGAWRVHEATLAADLDWWVAFSSMVSLVGSPGQGAHAAADAWLDAFVVWRRGLGLPATAINWGPWSRYGQGAGADERDHAVIRPADGIAALERILSYDRAHTCYTHVHLPSWLAAHPAVAGCELFAGVSPRTHGTGEGPGPVD
jgi:NADPH:quinone reductase-like Zn-dependent oxidoreductase